MLKNGTPCQRLALLLSQDRHRGGKKTYHVKDIRELGNRPKLVRNSRLPGSILLDALPSGKCGKHLCAIDLLQTPPMGTGDEAIGRVGPHMGHQPLPSDIKGSLVHIGREKDVCDLNDRCDNDGLDWLVQDDSVVECLDGRVRGVNEGLHQLGDLGVGRRQLGCLVGVF